MFESLAAEVDNLQVPLDGPAIGGFDRRSLWDLDAAVSMRAWLRTQAGLADRQAGREVTVARQLHDLPTTMAAWKNGSQSGGQIDLISAIVPARHRVRFGEHEAGLIPDLARLDIEGTARVLNPWVARADADTDELPTDPEPVRSLHLSPLLDGRARLDANLDPDQYAVLATALRIAETGDLDGEPVRTPAERRADALDTIAGFFLDHHHAPAGTRNRPHLHEILDAGTGTARYLDGPALGRHVLETLFCDSAYHRVLRDGRSTILDDGTATRVITAALWIALAIRDEHCRFAGCDRPAAWCDAHHVIWFSHGGETNQANLVLLCRHHHRLRHRPGWHAKLLPDATFEATNPGGVTYTSHPAGALRPFGSRRG